MFESLRDALVRLWPRLGRRHVERRTNGLSWGPLNRATMTADGTDSLDTPVLWLDEIRSDDIGSVGGNGASLGEMTAAGLPVPPGIVVTAGTYRAVIEENGIEEELLDAVEID